jgi:hypothetical protein
MAATAAGQRPYQVVVYGATSFTGKLVCEHIARDYQVRVQMHRSGVQPQLYPHGRAGAPAVQQVLHADCKPRVAQWQRPC